MIKRIFMLLVALLATTAFVACGGDDSEGGGGGTPVSKLTVRPQSLSFSADGGAQAVSAQAPVQPTATTSTDWCEVSVGELQGGTKIATLTITVSPNKTSYARSAIVTVTAGTMTATVQVEQAEGKPDVPEGTITKKAADIAKDMYPGWNLGNTLEATGSGLAAETAWQPTKTSQAVIDAVKAAGFKSVRIPCSWDIHSDGNGTIDAAWMARVRQIVDYCITNGLYVVLNDHWDGGWLEVYGFSKSETAFQPLNYEEIAAKAARLKDIWTQIAQEFISYDEHLLFAGLNEPFQQYTPFNGHHQELAPVLKVYNAAFVEAVRATGGNNAKRTLVVQGPSTNIDSSCSYMPVSTLPESAGRLMVEVHFYDPGQFCGTFDSSGDKAYYFWGAANHSTDHNATWGEESYMAEQFGKLKTAYTSQGYPVIIGEYAGMQRTISGEQTKHDASVTLFYKCVNEYAVNNGIIPFAWDTNNAAGLLTEAGSSTVIDRSKCTVVGTSALAGINAGITAGKWPY